MSLVEPVVPVPASRLLPRAGRLDLPTTPFLELDAELVVRRYAAVAAHDLRPTVHYEVAANPRPELLGRLARAGCDFSVASRDEVYACLAAGATPDDLLYSAPRMHDADVWAAAAAGVRIFVVRSLAEVETVAAVAPRVAVLAALGAREDVARVVGLLRAAARLGVAAAGVTLAEAREEDAPGLLPAAAAGFARLREEGLSPWLLEVPTAEGLSAASVAEVFGEVAPRVTVRAGAEVVRDAGVLVSTVVGVLRRDGVRLVYLDSGPQPAIPLAVVETSADGGPCGPCILGAGPDHQWAALPLALREGDIVRVEGAGALPRGWVGPDAEGFDPVTTLVA